MRARIVAMGGLMLIGGFLSSCAMYAPHVSSLRSVSVPAHSPIDPRQVAFLPRRPYSPYEVVGSIRVSWFGIRNDDAILRDPQIQDALRKEAAKLGGDAVIELFFIPRVDRWPDHAVVPYSAELHATAIRRQTAPGSTSHDDVQQPAR
jgi:hypothetical protein